jgi:hypothetical protein
VVPPKRSCGAKGKVLLTKLRYIYRKENAKNAVTNNLATDMDGMQGSRDAGWSGQYLEEGATVATAFARQGRQAGDVADSVAVAPESFDVIVIGGGQAGLAAGYHVKQRGLSFVILDAAVRVGDAWRERWDSLRLFTPARFDGLDGLPFPAPAT